MLTRFSHFEPSFSLLDEVRRRMDHVWDDVDAPSTWRNALVHEDTAAPRVNIFDTGAAIVLKADVPGMTDKDIHVTVHEGVVTFKGERTADLPKDATPLRRERRTTQFSRSFSLPTKVDTEKTTAIVKDGVLTITLSKATEMQPRQIAVRGA